MATPHPGVRPTTLMAGAGPALEAVVSGSAGTLSPDSSSIFCVRSAAGRGQFPGRPAQPELRPGHGAAPGPAIHDVPAARPAV